MRLLDTHTFPPPQPEDRLKKRPYAILSHTWDDNEITFGHLSARSSGAAAERYAASWNKIQGALHQARRNVFNYIWIDTVCIDKSSSAELSEAINSMWRWYREAGMCFVYLSDVDPPALDADSPWSNADVTGTRPDYQQFRNSRWFRRGWTLQELIAPGRLVVHFYDNEWNHIGSLHDLVSIVAEATGIDADLFESKLHKDYSIAQRMSWAAYRETTRPEDRAYSLLGLLDVSLDIRYGEGERAFIRLQEEIIRQSADQSILAWGKPITQEEDSSMQRGDYGPGNLLATSPDAFADSRTIVSCYISVSSYTMTNRGLHLTAPIVNGTQILLNCRYSEDPTLAISLDAYPLVDDYETSSGWPPIRRLKEGYVSLKVHGEPSGFSRLQLSKMAEVVPPHTFVQLTVARMPDYLHRSLPPPAWKDHPGLGGRLWVVFEKGQRFDHERRDVPLVRSLGTPIAEPFRLVDSQPQPASDTYGLTYAIVAAEPEEHRLFDLRLHHPSGYGIGLRIDTTSARKFAVLQTSVIPNSDELHRSGRLVDSENAPAQEMLGKVCSIPPLMRVQVINWKYTAIAVLQKEDLSGERPYVLRVAMVRTSLRIWWKFVLFPRLPRILLMPKEVRDFLIFGIPIVSVIVSIAIFIPSPANNIILGLITVAAGVHICVHSPLLSSRRNR